MRAVPTCVAWAAAALVSSGCASLGAQQRADTLPAGEQQFSAELAVQSAVGRDLGGGTWTRWPYLGLAYRRGFTDRLELSAGLSLLALRLGGKVLLTDPADRKFALSVAPEVGGGVFGEEAFRDGLLVATLPVLAGVPLGERGQWVFGVRGQYLRTYPATTSTVAPFELFAAGVSVGAVIPIAESFAVMPEVSVLTPFGRDRFNLYGRTSPQLGGLDGGLVNVSLGFLFGWVGPKS